LADPTFDRARFARLLVTRRLGRTLVARAEADSTNDVAWEALAAGAPDGTVVVADAQARGRGRAGRAWYMAPGKGLALSLALHFGCEPRRAGSLPLVAGLALARALDGLRLATELKWPNDLLVAGRKLSGILCERRRLAAGTDAAVIGVGVNVHEQQDDFPPGLHGTVTSLALEGKRASREEIAARFLNAFEPLWAEHQEGEGRGALAAWKERAAFWGRTVAVRGPGGPLTGVARDLDGDGALILELADGRTATVVAGDVDVAPANAAPLPAPPAGPGVPP
jgi:BirA family biotin operon repressor/biotin-[acetyl-CoA-carboxylase] ligase